MTEIPALHQTDKANANVRLYEGPGTMIHSGGETPTDLLIEFRWLPMTGTFLTAVFDKPGPIQALPTDVFHLPDGTELSILMTRMMGGSFAPASIIEGWVEGEVENGQGPIAQIRFELPNFPAYRGEPIRSADELAGWFGRKVLEADGWNIWIDSVRDHNKLREEVKASGGFGLLDTCMIRRSDGSDFLPEDAIDVLKALQLFLSFLAGRWTAPLMQTGWIANTQPWYRWPTPHLGRWRGHPCLPEFIVEGSAIRVPDFAAAWSEFLRLWAQPDARETLTWAISWYVEANSAASSELTLTLSQAGLEVLAWHDLVVRGGMKRRTFKKVEAQDKLRGLLRPMKIPPPLPNGTGLGHLLAWAATQRPKLDGPKAFTQARNATVHPRPGLGRVDPAVRIDASRLGLWYLELGILHLLGYADHYVDRTFAFKQRRVPWA